MRKIYRADWKTFVVIYTLCFLLMAFFAILGGKDNQNIIIGISGLFLLFVGVVLLIVFSYVSIQNNSFVSVSPPFFNLFPKKTSISKITEINRQSTFRIFRGAIKSLYIFYNAKNGKTKWIELRHGVFKEATMGELVRDLKHLNPLIKLDAAAQKLMEKAK